MSGQGRLAGLILAAGLSSRMGCMKALLPLGSSSMIAEAVGRFRRGGIEEVWIVVGHQAEELIPHLEGLRVRWIFNPHYGEGMLASVAAGVQSLGPDINAFFVLPVDIPLVKPETIRRLSEAYRETRTAVVYPCFQGRRGHPPLLSRACAGALPRALEGGLRAYLSQYEAKALNVEVDDAGVLMDCDTPEDYCRLQAYVARERLPLRTDSR